MRFRVLGMMFASALLMVAADDPKDAVKKEYDKFEGTWKMDSFTVDGKATPIETFGEFRMTLKGENFTTVTAEGETKVHVVSGRLVCKSNMTIESDAEAFHIAVKRELFVDDKLKYGKSWHDRIPRNLV